MPDIAVECGAARRAAHIDGDAGRIGLGRTVPTHHTHVGDGGTDGDSRVNLNPEAHHRSGAGGQIPIGGGIVCCEHRADIGDTGRGSVQGSRTGHISNQGIQGRPQIVGDHHVCGW